MARSWWNLIKNKWDRECTPIECLIFADFVYRNCEIWIREQKYLVDLIALSNCGYDLTSGFAWLEI